MYRVEIDNISEFEFTVKSKDYEFNIGREKGIAPSATLLASLGSCIGVYVRKYCEGAGLKCAGFHISVEGQLDKEKPVCFREIAVSLDLGELNLDERRKDALLRFVKNCPIHNTLKANPKVDIKLT